MKKRAYGYLPDHLDARDVVYKVVAPRAIPDAADLTSKMPPVVDQGQLGACTGNGVAACVDFLHLETWAGPSSRLQIYYGERVIEKTVKTDSGAQIRDGVKVVHKTGASLEKFWPYVVSKFARKPPLAAFRDAAKRKITQYQRILTLDDMLDCIADGFPFVFGFSVPASFESAAMAKTGTMTWDKKEKVVGGHCVVGVGYDKASSTVICRNSWSSSWGRAGYFSMPFDFISDANCASDFWTLRK